jgi:hypothetical protein
MLGLVLLGITLGAAWTTLAGNSPENARSGNLALASVGGVDSEAGPDRRQSLLVDRLELPQACRCFDHGQFLPLSSDPAAPFYFGVSNYALENQCCTQCHAAGEQLQLSKSARNRVIQSCTICHADDSGPRR